MSLAKKLRALLSGAALSVLVIFPALADPETLRRSFPGAALGDLTGDGVLDAVVQPRRQDDLGAVVDGASGEQVTELPAGYLGLDWRLGTTRVVTGNFDGTLGDDVMLQSRAAGGAQTVVLSDALGTPALGAQTWADGYLGRHWSADAATLYAGDFNGDRRVDLLAQVIDDTVLRPPHGEPAYALLLADEGGVFSRINATWDRDSFDADWDPAKYDLNVGDVDGDGIADIALMARALNGRHSLVLGTPKGVFTDVVARWRGTATPAEAYAQSIKSFSDARYATSGEMYAEAAPVEEGGGMSMMSFTAGTPAVGALAGEAGVSGGAATYSLPIVVPPGRAGVQPAVSVGYSSRAGNGELGMGWSLNAGSSIHRCPQTMAQDGRTLGVTYSQTDDRLCLDGQRLVKVFGTYGANSAVYRTELESYARVAQTGSHINSESSSFTVKYDDGRVAYYGTSTATQFKPAGLSTTPLNWLLARVEDAAGNSVIYTYDGALTDGEALLTEIKYTGRGATPGDRKVAFTWEDRPDKDASYLWGGKSVQSKRLAMISTWVGTTAVREYRFSYETSDSTVRSRLISVEECAYQASTLYCLPATAFQWHAGSPTEGVVQFGIPAEDPADPAAWAWARNAAYKTNDGKAVRITLAAGSDPYAGQDPQALIDMAFAGGGAQPLPYEVSPGASFIGGGHKELWYQAGGVAQMLRAGPAGVDVQAYEAWPLIGQSFWEYEPDHSDRYADFNNDGRTDIFALTKVWHGTGGPWSSYDAKANATPQVNLNGTDWKVADFNGDGKIDAVMARDVQAQGQDLVRELFSYKNVTVNLQSPTNNVMLFQQPAFGTGLTGEAEHPQGGWYGPRLTRVTDVNGDGLPDILFKGHDLPDFPQPVDRLLRNTSTASAITFADESSPTTDPDDLYMWADVNGDGLEDVVRKGMGPNGTGWQVKINHGGNSGDGFNAAEDLELPTVPIPCYGDWCEGGLFNVGMRSIRVGDVDNDGRAEVLVPIDRVATLCMADITYWSDDHGTWVTGPLCANALYREVPDLLKYDASFYVYAAYRVVPTTGDNWTTVDTGIRFTAPGTGFTFADATGDGLNDLVWSVNRNSQMYYDSTNAGHGCDADCVFAFPKYGNYLSVATQEAPDMMVSATDGLGRVAEWSYDPLSKDKPTLTGNTTGIVGGAKLYAQSGGYIDDQHFYFTSTMYVVSEFRQKHFGVVDGPGAGTADWCQGLTCDATWSKTTYAYRDAMFNNQGRGFQGFGQVIEEDPARGLRTISTFLLAYPQTGRLASSLTERISDRFALASTTNTWTTINPVGDGFTALPVLDYSDQYTYHLSGGTPVHTATDPVYPASGLGGCLSSSTTTTTDEFGTYTRVLTHAWTVDVSTAWWPCKLTSKIESSTASISARHGQALHTAPAKPIKTTYTYNTRRQLLAEAVGPDPANAALTRTTTHTYNDTVGNVLYGNRIQTTVSGGSGATAIAPRTLYFDLWTTDGYFNNRVRNDLDHLVFTHFDAAHGLPTQVLDPNFVDTYVQYDAFGRKAATWVEDLPVQTTAYADCTGCDSVARARYKVTVTQSGTPTQVTYFDRLNRAIETRMAAFTGTTQSIRDTVYDHLGRVREASEPYETLPARQKSLTASYDLLDRPAQVVDAKGLTINYVHTGLVTAATATDGTISQTTTQEKNALGQLLTSIDHYSNKTHFRYDSQGNPVSIKDAIGATVTAVHNEIGQKTSLSDPDMGNWTYVYDVLGQLKTQTDAKAQVTTFVYDVLGRMDSRTEPSGAGTCTTDWVYDTAVNGTAKLKHVEQGCDGAKEEYNYDAKGRVIKVITTLEGAEYAVDTTYDSYGRVDTVAYPDPASGGGQSGPPSVPTNVYASADGNMDATVHWGAPATGGAVTEYRVYKKKSTQSWSGYQTVGGSGFEYYYSGLTLGTWQFKVVACNGDGCGPESAVVEVEIENGNFMGGGVEPMALTSSFGTRFAVKHVYNANGHLAEVQDADGLGLIWKATGLNAYGAVTAEQYGNNLTTTRVYGMTGAPFVTNITTGASGAVQKLDYVWSKFGHLTQRKSTSTGITPNTMEENFVYDLINRLDTAQVKLNGGSAVTVMDLAYDAVGNLTQKIDTAGTKNYAYHATKKHAVTGITGTASQTFAYDANGNMSTRNAVTQVWNAANLPTTLATSTYTATFSYGPSRARYKQEATYSGRTETTRYVGSLYEKFSRTDQAGVQHRYRVFAYGRPVAQVTDFTSSSTRQTRYMHGDHLGSIDAITNEAGAVITDGRMSFDAHGNRRAAMTSQGTAWQALLKYPANASLIDGNGTTTGLRSVTSRGFTDHEMLDNVGLIHMNGRVYDPVIGRFLSVDPVFQFPEDTQSINPYSYVRNSPLSATDPTGYCEDKDNCPSEDTPPPKKDWRSLGAHKSNLGAKTGAGTSGVGARTGGEMARDIQDNISLGSRIGGIAASAPNAANRGQGPSDAVKKPAESADTGSTASRSNTDGAAGGLTSPQGAADVALGVLQGQSNALWDVVALGWEYTVPGLANFVKNNLMFEAGSSEQQFGQDVSLAVPLPFVASTRVGIAAAMEIRAATRTTTVIGKLGDLKNLAAGEQALLGRLSNLGSPKANWAQNSSVLRQELSRGNPIRDASVDGAGRLINNTGFLRAERNLLENRGWSYDTGTTMWYPPVR